MGDLQPWLMISSGGFLAVGLLLLLLRLGRRADQKFGNNNSNINAINVAGDINGGGSAPGPSAGWQWFFGLVGIAGLVVSLWPLLK